MLTLKEIPNIENNYLLELSKGWFGVVVPTQKENLVINPNFVNYPSNSSGITYSNSILSSKRNGIYSPYSLEVRVFGNGSITYNLPSNISGLYTFSVYIRAINKTGQVTVTFNGAGTSKSINISDSYQRIYFSSHFPNNATSKGIILSSNDIDFEITSMQIEEGFLTTFFSGDSVIEEYDADNAYNWTGEKYKSTSVRTLGAYSGGEIVSLLEYGFKVISVEGIGYPDLVPITFNQATRNKSLYLRSNIDQREISINGIINTNSFSEFIKIRGKLGKLFYHEDRPTRVYFTPYEHCEDTECIYFDMLYEDGLNNEIDSLYGQELSISGITLEQCVYSCEPYEYKSVSLRDMKVTTNTNDLFFIKDDNTITQANIPQYTTGSNYRIRLIDAAEYNGVLYIIVEQSTATKTESHFLSYISGTWTRILTIEVTSALGDSLHNSYGLMGTLAAVSKGEYTEGIWVGGYFRSSLFNLGTGITLAGVTSGDSLFVYKPSSKTIRLWDVYHSTPTDKVGTVNDIAYNQETGNIYIAGRFTQITEGEFIGTHITNNIIQVNTNQPFISLINTNGITFTGSGGATGGINYSDSSSAQIKKVIELGNYVYILCNGYIGTYNVVTNVTSFFIRYDKVNNYIKGTAFPFVSEGAATANGAMIDAYVYKNMLVTSGRFTQANSYFRNNSVNYNSNYDYLSNVSYFDPDGFSTPFNIFYGLHKPLQYSLSTVDNFNFASGIFNTSNNESPPISADVPYIEIDVLNDNLLFYGNFNRYGRSTDKKETCGFVEYIVRSATDLSKGTFVPPSLAVSNGVCWPKYKSIDTIYNLKAIVGHGTFPLVTQTSLYYNTGIVIDNCGSSRDTDIDILVESNNGIVGLYGIRNLTTGKYIYFVPENIGSNKLFTLKVINNNLYIEYYSGSKEQVTTFASNGNPLEISDNDVIQVLFDMLETNELTSNPTITAKYKRCYASFDEFMVCQ